MKLIKSSYEILDQKPGLEGIYEQIELAGRTCYASSHKIQYQENETCDGQFSTTAKGFVDRMIASQHYAMLEHGTVYLKRTGEEQISWKYQINPYSKVNCVYPKDDVPNIYCVPTHYITTNYRVLVENGWLDDLKYFCEPTEHHEKRIAVHFVCDRGVSHEFVRHRVFSFAQESTRYCNYSKDKFGNELTFIIPSWVDAVEDGNTYSYDTYIDIWQKSEDANTSNFLQSIAWAEKNYLTLLYNGWTPQQARQVLPNALKTELVMTGFVSDWQHLFRLRTSFIAETGKPHPDMSNLCDPLYKEFIEKGFHYKIN